MKKILTFTAIICAAVLFVSCGAKDDKTQVKEVIESYIKASASMDYAKIKTLVTPESVAAIEQAEQMLNSLPEEAKKMVQEASKNISFNSESIVINEDKASAVISYMGAESPLSLKKIDGKWLIAEADASTSASYDEEGGDIDEEYIDEEGEGEE